MDKEVPYQVICTKCLLQDCDFQDWGRSLAEVFDATEIT